MSIGQKVIQINPSERVVSSDHNRVQTFAGSEAADRWAAIASAAQGSDDTDAGGLYSQAVTDTSPSTATVWAGLTVLPQTGNFNILVAPGSIDMVDVETPQSPDESLNRTINDPGVQTIGGLLEVANAGGSPRIDVIECSRTIQVLETDNRDIFNPVTGLFSTQTVNKVVASRLTYRVRQGTIGGGFPGTAAGWLPLAVASVPPGATSNDQITFWDVRPLAAGRLYQPFNVTRRAPLVPNNDLAIVVVGGVATLQGTVDCAASDRPTPLYALYRLGGRITGGANLNSATFFQDGTVAGFTGPVYVYLAEPFGLPRWAAYATGGARLPQSQRGFVIASRTIPVGSSVDGFGGGPVAAIALPAVYGLSTSTSKAICVAVTHATGGTIDGEFLGTNKTQYASLQGSPPTPIFPTSATTPVITGGGLIATFSLVAGTQYPSNAKALIAYLRLAITASGTTTEELEVTVVDVGGGSVVVGHACYTITATGQYGFLVRIPMQQDVSTSNLVVTSSSLTITSGEFLCEGWEV